MLAERVATVGDGRVRVAVDGPPVAEPLLLALQVVGVLRTRGRPAVAIRAETFWRDTALRFEHGRTDPESFATQWLDTSALRREVLDPLGPGGDGRYLPSLRDPATNRSTREPVHQAPDGLVVLVAGELLLGRGLPFDHAVHLALTPGARRRRTPADQAWTLAAYDRYDLEVDPAGVADVVIRYDDPSHPAISCGTLPG